MAKSPNAGCRPLPLSVFLLVMFACFGLVGDAEAGGGAGLQSSDTFGVGERISTFPADFSGFSCNLHNPASIVFQGGVLTATIGATGRIQCSDYSYTCDTSFCEIVDQVVTQGIVRRESTGGGTNRPPRATGSVPAQTLTAGGSSASVNVARYFTDPDGDRLTYTARSSRTGVVRASVSGSTVTLSPVSAGIATVTVTARDPDGANATQSIAVTVEEDGGTNRPPRPTGSIPAQTLTVGGAATSLNVARYFTDPDGDRLTYSAASSRTVIVRASASGGTVTLTPVSAGSATVTVTARDPDGLSATQSIAVTVQAGGGVNGFTDDPLVPGVTPVRAVHFRELRTRIDTLRAGAGLSAYRWTDPGLTAGVTRVRSVHLTELRAALNQAYAAAGQPRPTYIDASVRAGTTPIRAAHVTELRAAVVDLENAAPTGLMPDLVVGPPTVSDSTLTPGQSFTLSATVRNRGSARAAATTLRYYRSTNSTISTSDTEVGTDAVSALAGGASGAESIRQTAPSSAGTYYYGACVDPVSEESDTGNNCSSGVQITVDSGGEGTHIELVRISRCEAVARVGSLLRIEMEGTVRALVDLFDVTVWGRVGDNEMAVPDLLGSIGAGTTSDFFVQDLMDPERIREGDRCSIRVEYRYRISSGRGQAEATAVLESEPMR